MATATIALVSDPPSPATVAGSPLLTGAGRRPDQGAEALWGRGGLPRLRAVSPAALGVRAGGGAGARGQRARSHSFRLADSSFRRPGGVGWSAVAELYSRRGGPGGRPRPGSDGVCSTACRSGLRVGVAEGAGLASRSEGPVAFIPRAHGCDPLSASALQESSYSLLLLHSGREGRPLFSHVF
jgi:hypothetical protein